MFRPPFSTPAPGRIGSRATGAPVTAWAAFEEAVVTFLPDEGRVASVNPGVTRSFCGSCGSPVSYECDERPEEIDLFAVTLERPEGIVPQDHDFTGEMLPWVHLADGLPRK